MKTDKNFLNAINTNHWVLQGDLIAEGFVIALPKRQILGAIL